MLDRFQNNFQAGAVFEYPGVTLDTRYRWTKPKGYKMFFTLCIGAGAAGAGGAGRSAGIAKLGGGGGGSGALSWLLMPLHLVPDTLFVKVGGGALGGTAGSGGNGGTGGGSASGLVDTSLGIATGSTTAMATLCHASSGAGGVGSGTGGNGGAASTVSNMFGPYLGLWKSTQGGSGTAGGASSGANGGSRAILVTTIGRFAGGTGGGGSTSADFTGGPITGLANSFFPLGLDGGAAGSFAGNPGFLYGAGVAAAGTGGGSSNSAVGGNGGDGVTYGSGGGGGGAGVPTGGVGGKGGPGYCLIVCF